MKYCSFNCLPVGKPSSSGDVQPESSSNCLAALSILYRQGENTLTCSHEWTFAATDSPASNSIKGIFLTARCAAADKPMGPPPTMATGNNELCFIVILRLISV